MLGAQRRPDRRAPRVSIIAGAESDQRAARVVRPAGLGEPARGLESSQNGERKENPGDGRDPEHGAPAARSRKRLID